MPHEEKLDSNYQKVWDATDDWSTVVEIMERTGLSATSIRNCLCGRESAKADFESRKTGDGNIKQWRNAKEL